MVRLPLMVFFCCSAAWNGKKTKDRNFNWKRF